MRATEVLNLYRTYLEQNGNRTDQTYYSKALTTLRDKIQCDENILSQIETLLPSLKHTMHAVIWRFYEFLKAKNINVIVNDLPTESEIRKKRAVNFKANYNRNSAILSELVTPISDIEFILSKFDPEQAALFGLLSIQGLSPDKICKLKTRNVDLKKKKIVKLRDKQWEVPIHRVVLPYLKTYSSKFKRPNTNVFFYNISARRIETISSKAFKLLGVTEYGVSTKYWTTNAIRILISEEKQKLKLETIMSRFQIGYKRARELKDEFNNKR
jgi:integrase